MVRDVGLLGSACILLSVVPAFSATFLCVEESSTGFNWRNETWVETSFNKEQRLVRKYNDPASIAGQCLANLVALGLNQALGYGPDHTATYGCYASYEVGTVPSQSDVQICMERWDEKNTHIFTNCDSSPFEHFKFLSSGEYVYERSYAAPEDPDPKRERDSLVLSIGKCSQISD